MNLAGKTQLSQMTPVDFIGNFVLGGIIGGVIYTDDISMHQYILVLLLGIALISVLNFITRKFHVLHSITIGNPIPIIKDGKFLMHNILAKQNKIDMLSVASQMHAQGIHSFQNVTYAQIEPNGQICVVCEGKDIPSVILMKDGKCRPFELHQIEKNDKWLKQQIKASGINKIEDIFIAEYWNDKLKFIMRDGEIKKPKHA